jgi:voltage-gated potassium channel
MKNLHSKIHYLYESNERPAIRFRYALLCFDIFVLFYLIASSFYYNSSIIGFFDILLGIAVLIDFSARFAISKSPLAYFLNLFTLADIMVILSLLLPVLGSHMAFLRVIRMFRLLRSYSIIEDLGNDFPYIKKHRDIVVSCTNLFIFIFIMTALVFETQVKYNPNINNYLDALYFTITTLTTTGFGDITMQGSDGRLIAVLIMIFGVSLFIRLVQTIFRPSKVRFTCKECGLYLHDADASHCKHCGNTIAIPDDGLD